MWLLVTMVMHDIMCVLYPPLVDKSKSYHNIVGVELISTGISSKHFMPQIVTNRVSWLPPMP